MDFFDKYLYLFDYWTKDLLKPFEDDFFTNASEISAMDTDYKKAKFIEFVKEDGVYICFEFVLAKDTNDHLSICFDCITIIKGYYSSGHNEFYLYHHKEKLKKIINHLQAKIIEIKRILHENEGHRIRFAVGIDLFDKRPDTLDRALQDVLNTTENDYKKLEKEYEKILKS